ncbi:MAG: twin-arginine translocase TatA/TatE family subunit [Chitinophagaceae bacterium]
MVLLHITPQMLIHLPGGDQMIWLLLAVVIFFGGRKIPELARGLGKGIREFNDAKDGVKKEIESGLSDKPTNPANTANPTNTPTT